MTQTVTRDEQTRTNLLHAESQITKHLGKQYSVWHAHAFIVGGAAIAITFLQDLAAMMKKMPGVYANPERWPIIDWTTMEYSEDPDVQLLCGTYTLFVGNFSVTLSVSSDKKVSIETTRNEAHGFVVVAGEVDWRTYANDSTMTLLGTSVVRCGAVRCGAGRGGAGRGCI
jgi:hypothetical protein